MRPALALPLLLAACAAGVEQAPIALTSDQAKELDKQIGGKLPGEPLTCLPMSHNSELIRISDEILIYRQSSNLVYQSKLPYPCPGLARDDDLIVSEQFGGQQCKGDSFRLVDRYSGFSAGACVFGAFVPYRKSAAARPVENLHSH